MNERIRELWDKAAESTKDDSWQSHTLFMERFAELIVRECVLISRTSADGFSAGWRMAERFGVES